MKVGEFVMIEAQISAALAAVEENLLSAMEGVVAVLGDASRHIVTSGGKRLRPRLTLMAYLAAGGQTLETALPLATAIELVHTATLVHDDINDHSLTRRGKVSVHARWGRTFALLTGDYLFSKVYELMAPYGNPCNEIMSTACVRLVEGETLQAAAAKTGEMNREVYKTIIERKTASLFEAGARMGAVVAGAEPEVVDALAEYARNVGMAFQIVDDILDVVGDAETLGKPTGLDATQGRGLAAVQNGRGGDQTHPAAVLEAEAEPDPLQAMFLRLRESGALELAHLQAVELAERARTALQAVPPSPARDSLERLIDDAINRQR